MLFGLFVGGCGLLGVVVVFGVVVTGGGALVVLAAFFCDLFVAEVCWFS
jgi:hypothetical protein